VRGPGRTSARFAARPYGDRRAGAAREGTADGPAVWSRCRLPWDSAPACMSWSTIGAPAACTRSVTARQPATCRSVTMPGWLKYPWLYAASVYVPSVITRPKPPRANSA